MSQTPNLTRKRLREDEEGHDLHEHRPPRKGYADISAHDYARQNIGDQYHGNINIYQDAASASTPREPTAIEAALNSLLFDEMDSRYLTINTSLGSSCRWLLDREEYKRWQDIGCMSQHHGFLWIKGKAGAGKSTLMKFAFDIAKTNRREHQVVVSFFFNARGAPMERSQVGMYRALLHQILHRIPRLKILLGKERTLSAQSHDWSLDLLRSVFQDVIENLASEHLICYVDALDECTEDDVKEMVSFFEDLGEMSVSGDTKFHVCFASRHYPYITIDRSENIIVEGQDGHKADISSYIKKKLKISNISLKEELSKQIEDRASSVFLWVVLVVHVLNDECDRGNMQTIRTRLKEMPTKVTNLIQDILDRDKPTRYLVPLLQWMLFSRRPLSPKELFLGLQSIESETIQDSHLPEALADDNVGKFILNTSKGLVEMTKGRHPRVQFIHELVRAHFLGPEGLVKLEPRLQKSLVGQSHDQLKQCCYNYLTSDLCKYLPLPKDLPWVEKPDGMKLRRETLVALPFLQYVVGNIFYHANRAHVEVIEQHEFIESFPFETWKRLANAIAEYTGARRTDSVSLAYIFAEERYTALLIIAMEHRPRPDEPKEPCRSILGAAIESGDIGAVQAVLNHKGYENVLGRGGSICMTLAIESNELKIVQALVAAKVKPYSTNVSAPEDHALAENNALVPAILQSDKFGSDLGPCGLFRLLLNSLTEDDKVNESCVTALEYAFEASCRSNQEDNARLLLPEIAHSHVWANALVAASTNGHISIVHMLLNCGTYVNSIDRYAGAAPDKWYNALQRACQNGHLDIARLLVQHGAEINEASSMYGTPLLLASQGDHIEIVQFLLDNDADINLPEATGFTPLLIASACGRSAVARLLIENGADIHRTCEQGKTALCRAVDRKTEPIVRYLIEKGADVNVKASSGESVLSSAKKTGKVEIIELLIDNGAVE